MVNFQNILLIVLHFSFIENSLCSSKLCVVVFFIVIIFFFVFYFIELASKNGNLFGYSVCTTLIVQMKLLRNCH